MEDGAAIAELTEGIVLALGTPGVERAGRGDRHDEATGLDQVEQPEKDSSV